MTRFSDTCMRRSFALAVAGLALACERPPAANALVAEPLTAEPAAATPKSLPDLRSPAPTGEAAAKESKSVAGGSNDVELRDGTLVAVNGAKTRLSSLWTKKPTIVVFYRGFF
jgi:hypothetical protein